MKIVTVEGKKTKISEPQIRSLELLKRKGFVAPRSDFWEGSNRHLTFALVIAEKWGVSEKFPRSDMLLEQGLPDNPVKVRQFFRDNPRCKSAIVGAPRRINSILCQIERS